MAKIKKIEGGPHLMTVTVDFVREGPIYLCKKCADKEKFPYKTFTAKGVRVVGDDPTICSKCEKAVTA